jgi:hypothetical protein
VCLKCVTKKPRRNEEAQAHLGLSSHRKKKKNLMYEKAVPAIRQSVSSRRGVSVLFLNNVRFMMNEVTLAYVTLQELSAFPC